MKRKLLETEQEEQRDAQKIDANTGNVGTNL